MFIHFLSFRCHLQAQICMRCFTSLLLLITIISGCSKPKTEKTNFAEITVDGKKFVFNKLEAIFDTSSQYIACNFQFDDTASNSNMIWEILTGTKRIIGTYIYPGELFPGRSVVLLHLQTYINRIPGTYSPKNNSFTVIIDRSENGRIHGTLSGTMICYTCIPYGAEVPITNGEFEMPYGYR